MGTHFGISIMRRQNKFKIKLTGLLESCGHYVWCLKSISSTFEGTDGLYEIRVKVGSDIYRIFCFFDKGQLVILLNGFQKKSEKTPRQEIERAERLKKQYYEDQEK